MDFELTASMMCANFGNLEHEVRELEAGGIDSFHIDIMDGRYVPNYAMSLNDMKYIAGATKKPLDVHLMIEHPQTHIDIFLKNLRKGDTVYIHPEAEYHPSTTLKAIIDAGMIPGIAINPGTSIETVMEMLRIVDKVLVMSVNPGFGGQKLIPSTLKKVRKLIEIREKNGFDWQIEIDGGVNRDTLPSVIDSGVDILVAGSAVFNAKYPAEEIQYFKELL